MVCLSVALHDVCLGLILGLQLAFKNGQMNTFGLGLLVMVYLVFDLENIQAISVNEWKAIMATANETINFTGKG